MRVGTGRRTYPCGCRVRLPATACGAVDHGPCHAPRVGHTYAGSFGNSRRRLLAGSAAVAGGWIAECGGRDARSTSGPLVAPELMAPPISSPLFPADITERTPHVQRQMNGHGYLTVQVVPDRVSVAFRGPHEVANPTSAIATIANYGVASGSPKATAQ